MRAKVPPRLNDMQAHFRLGFTEDFDTWIEWVETGKRAIIPAGHPLYSSEDVKAAAMAVFPMYAFKVATFKRKEKDREIWRDRYFKKLVPQIEKFKFPSYTVPGKYYTISVVDRGRGRLIHCSCWPYIKTHRRCDHIYGWLKLKEHPVADELAVQEGPTKVCVPSLARVINATLRTGDIDPKHEKKFTDSVRRTLRCQRNNSKSGWMTSELLRTRLGCGVTTPTSS